MSATAIRNMSIEFERGPRLAVPVRQGVVRHHLSPADAVERCECGKRLASGQHELCPRCDAEAWNRMPLPTVQAAEGAGA